MIKKNSKTGNTDRLFFNGKHWQSLTNNHTGEFLAEKTLREKFGELNVMKSVLSLDETPSALERSFKVSTKLRRITNGYRDGKYIPGGACVFS